MKVAQKAKDLGILVAAVTRGQDMVSEENFRKLSSGRMTWFGTECEHLRYAHRLTASGTLCQVAETKGMVRTWSANKRGIVGNNKKRVCAA